MAGNQQQRTPGLECPKCHHFIPTTIAELLSAQYLECPHCRLRLTINKKESKKALDILSNVNDAQNNLDKASKFNR